MDYARTKQQDGDQYKLRFADGLRERLAESASKNGRSINAEINTRLLASYAIEEAAGPSSSPVAADAIAAMVAEKVLAALRSESDVEAIADRTAEKVLGSLRLLVGR